MLNVNMYHTTHVCDFNLHNAENQPPTSALSGKKIGHKVQVLLVVHDLCIKNEHENSLMYC